MKSTRTLQPSMNPANHCHNNDARPVRALTRNHPRPDKRRPHGYRNNSRLPDNWRGRLPDASKYYTAHVGKLGRPNSDGWASGCCPFHDDKTPSLSVNLQHGGWCCFAGCGKGDLVNFHMKRTGMRFADAVRDLVAL